MLRLTCYNELEIGTFLLSKGTNSTIAFQPNWISVSEGSAGKFSGLTFTMWFSSSCVWWQ